MNHPLTSPKSSGYNGGQSELSKAVIEQLAKEIQSGADLVVSLRTRSAFTIWIGPYIVLGSILVGAKGGFTIDYRNPSFIGAVVVAAFCYVTLGYLAGRIEKHTSTRSNNLRRCIASIVETGKLDMSLYLDEVLPAMIVDSYRLVFLILLLCFFGVAVAVSTIQPRPKSKAPAAQEREPSNG